MCLFFLLYGRHIELFGVGCNWYGLENSIVAFDSYYRRRLALVHTSNHPSCRASRHGIAKVAVRFCYVVARSVCVHFTRQDHYVIFASRDQQVVFLLVLGTKFKYISWTFSQLFSFWSFTHARNSQFLHISYLLSIKNTQFPLRNSQIY